MGLKAIFPVEPNTLKKTMQNIIILSETVCDELQEFSLGPLFFLFKISALPNLQINFFSNFRMLIPFILFYFNFFTSIILFTIVYIEPKDDLTQTSNLDHYENFQPKAFNLLLAFVCYITLLGQKRSLFCRVFNYTVHLSTGRHQ